MGSTNSEFNANPIQMITIDEPFFIGIHPVTQKQYERVMDICYNPSEFKGPNRPVENISWYDAVKFCEKLSSLENLKYHLPSEKQWEYACRAGTVSDYYWGNKFNHKYCWCNKEQEKGTIDVGMMKPNPWGLFDISGNVWEWCSYISCGRASRFRILCGGSWYSEPGYCRSASRRFFPPETKCSPIGFRVIRTF